MLLAGDEVGWSQAGNNNVWCQDNALGWFDWDLVESNHALLRFVSGLIGFRRRYPGLRRRTFNDCAEDPKVSWHGVKVAQPDWAEHSRSLAMLTEAADDAYSSYLITNVFWEPLEFALPLMPHPWCTVVDTARQAPLDFVVPRVTMPIVDQSSVLIAPRSTTLLIGRPVS